MSDATCPAPRHDTATAYRSNGCRCPEAKRQQWLAQKRYRLRMNREGVPLLVDAAGTIRRVQALRSLGWPLTALAAKLGVTKQRVQQFGTQAQGRVHRDLAARVAAVYDELSMTPGPGDIRVHKRAALMGWPPPLAWDDDTIDDPASRPFGVPLPQKGIQRAAGAAVVWDDLRWEDVDRLRSYGVPDTQIAERFGISEKSLAKAEARWGRGAVA